MKTKRGMSFYLVAVIGLLVIAVAVPVGAGNGKPDLNRLLTGNYFGTGYTSCTYAYIAYDQGMEIGGGFNENFRRLNPIVPGAPTISFSSQGVRNYDGHGNWTSTGTSLIILNDPAGSTSPRPDPVSRVAANCYGTYKVHDDLSTEGDGECIVTPLPPFSAGTHPDAKVVIKGMGGGKGQLLGTMGNILSISASDEPRVEELFYYNFYVPNPGGGDPILVPGPFKMAERICNGTGIGIKMTGRIKGDDPGVRGK